MFCLTTVVSFSDAKMTSYSELEEYKRCQKGLTKNIRGTWGKEEMLSRLRGPGKVMGHRHSGSIVFIYHHQQGSMSTDKSFQRPFTNLKTPS